MNDSDQLLFYVYEKDPLSEDLIGESQLIQITNLTKDSDVKEIKIKNEEEEIGKINIKTELGIA